MVLYSIGRSNGDDLDIVFDRDLTDKAMGELVRPRTQSERILALSVYWNASNLDPLLADDLQADTVIGRRGHMLHGLAVTACSFDMVDTPLASSSNRRSASRWSCHEGSRSLHCLVR